MRGCGEGLYAFQKRDPSIKAVTISTDEPYVVTWTYRELPLRATWVYRILQSRALVRAESKNIL